MIQPIFGKTQFGDRGLPKSPTSFDEVSESLYLLGVWAPRDGRARK